jgi:hypothetical protein
MFTMLRRRFDGALGEGAQPVQDRLHVQASASERHLSRVHGERTSLHARSHAVGSPTKRPSSSSGLQSASGKGQKRALTASEKDLNFAELLALGVTAGAMYVIFSQTGASNFGIKLAAVAIIGLICRWFFRSFTTLTRVLRYAAMAMIILALFAFLQSVWPTP